MTSIELTQTVQKGGCAAKIAATELRKILGGVRFPPVDPAVLVDGRDFDDAAIYRVAGDLALVQTLDFFTPIVDTPETFGKIAAANALSDVYAMGGTPKTALAILAFPLATLAPEVAGRVLQGACDILAEAGASLVGGHSIDDDTLKFGLSVTGLVDPRRVWSNAGARPGNALILTKPLGTGTLTAALKRREMTEADIADAIDSMTTLNRTLDLLGEGLAPAVRAATDITGFGLLGHALQLARASRVALALEAAAIARLTHAERCLQARCLTKAHRSNLEYVAADVRFGACDETTREILVDPQTSGGLLLAVDGSAAGAVVRALRVRFGRAAIVGAVGAPSEFSIEVRA